MSNTRPVRAPRNPEFVRVAEARRATFTALVEAQQSGIGLEAAERDHAASIAEYERVQAETQLRSSTVRIIRNLSIRSLVEVSL